MNATGDPAKGFMGRLAPAVRGGGFHETDHWIWGASVLPGDDGQYHMFAARWSKSLPFNPNWLTNSEIVRAVAERPAGPYRYAETILGIGDLGRWDGGMVHNPSVRHCPLTGMVLLFYTGSTYAGPIPESGAAPEAQHVESQSRQCIGLATGPSPAGPWIRRDTPFLGPNPGHWDAHMVSNPAPCVLADGTIILGYKSQSAAGEPTNYGLARAASWDAPAERVADEPLFHFPDPEAHIEDAFLWHEDGRFHMIFKDRTDRLTGEFQAGAYAYSDDAIHWQLGDPPKAWSRALRWADGEVSTLGSLERPQLLLEDGHPTHLFCAAADGPGGFWRASHTWNQCVPLRA